jgi:glycosyltransferase involved in cell wall biosynthesis
VDPSASVRCASLFLERMGQRTATCCSSIRPRPKDLKSGTRVIPILHNTPEVEEQPGIRIARKAGGILLISYHFPPSAAVGGRRAANFAASLRSLGWDVRALTIPDRAIEQIDRGRLQSVKGVPIDVAAVWPTLVGVVSALARLRRQIRPAEPPAVPPAVPDALRPMAAPRGESIARRLRRYFLSFGFLPDGEKGWIVPAVIRAVRIIRRQRLDWFMTSCPPYSVHVIGLAVKTLSGARWVADFRDPWMTTGSKRLYPTCAASLGIESWLERRVIENADLVVFNVERLRDAYRARYGDVPPDKLVFIPNGIAAQPQNAERAMPRYERFTISYTGSLYVGRSPEPVFEAVSRLIQSGAVQADAVRILLVGQCRLIDRQPTESVVRRHGLESVVEVQDQVPHAQAVEVIRRSHLALLLAPNLPYQIPAKVYDYLGAGTRVLAIAEEGGTADLLKATGAGVAFPSTDVDGIAAFILEELGTGSPEAPRVSSLARYDVTRITSDLVDHMARVQC